MRFLNPNHIPSIPKSYTLTKGDKVIKVHWHQSVPFGGFLSSVRATAETNGITPPTAEEVEDAVCRQLPKGWCTGQQNYRPPAPKTVGCSSCGRRRG